MTSKKMNLRQQLESGMTVFLSEGKQVTKLPTYGKKREPKPKFVEVEINLDYLPTALRKKHFGEM